MGRLGSISLRIGPLDHHHRRQFISLALLLSQESPLDVSRSEHFRFPRHYFPAPSTGNCFNLIPLSILLTLYHFLRPSSILLLPDTPNLVTSTVKTFTFPVTTSPLHLYPLSGQDCKLLPTSHSSFTHQHFLRPSWPSPWEVRTPRSGLGRPRQVPHGLE